ncbi:MAG: DUF3426 domain-containing protein [Pseudomonadota bacterium]
MILVCPSCATRYKIDGSSLGEAGRQVKCARCGEVWHAMPTPDEPPPIDTRAAEMFASASPVPTPADEEPAPEEEDPPPIPPAPDLSAVPETRNGLAGTEPKRATGAGWALLGLAVIGVVLAGYAGRDQLISAWPPAAKLYDVLGIPHEGAQIVSELAGGGLVVTDVESLWDDADGTMTLTVRGTVANQSEVERAVPPLVVWLAAEDDRQLQSWGLTLDTESLAPGESVPFETSIENPTEDAKRVEIAVLDG